MFESSGSWSTLGAVPKQFQSRFDPLSSEIPFIVTARTVKVEKSVRWKRNEACVLVSEI